MGSLSCLSVFALALMVAGGTCEAHAGSGMGGKTEPTLSEALRKAAHGPVRPVTRHDEERLRRMGLDEATMGTVLHALRARPHSACAQTARQLLEDGKGASAAFVQADQRLVSALREGRVCPHARAGRR